MNGGISGIAYADSLGQKASTEFQRSLNSSSSHGGPKTKQPLESNLQEALAQQGTVSELHCCNCGRWGSEGSSYVVDGQEKSRRLGCFTVTCTAENPAVYGMY